MTAAYDNSDLEKAIEVVKERNREYLARKAIGCDHAADVTAPTLRIFSGE